ncbi:MAG: hypothetical protein R3Y50_07975 [Rikenellaceae bacterium]
MRKRIYLELKDRLKRLIINDSGDIEMMSDKTLESIEKEGVSPNYAIKHFALWNRQIEFIGEESIFDMPAIFFEFGKATWRHQSRGLQETDFTIILHVLTQAVPEGYDGDLFHLDLLDCINKCLHGYSTDYTTSISRIASIPCHDHMEILDSTEIFNCVLYDDSAVYKLVKVRPDADIGVTFKKV